jgi:hypothetical protein
MNVLEWVVDPLPPKAGSQNRMARDEPLPGEPQEGGIQRLLERADYLLDVHSRVPRVETVEQHSLLHRGERIGRLQLFGLEIVAQWITH